MESGAETLVTTPVYAFSIITPYCFVKSKVESMRSRFDHQQGECREQRWCWMHRHLCNISLSFGAGFIPTSQHSAAPVWAHLTEPFNLTPVLFPLSFAVPGHTPEQGRSRQTLHSWVTARWRPSAPRAHRLPTLNLFLLSLPGEQC